MGSGLFITFEGPEGGGKSTQIKKLANHLKSQGKEVVLLREPGGPQVSEAIRSILLDNKNAGMEPQTELLLYLAARSEIVRKEIMPALQEGKYVLCDRYEDSTLAYQGYGREELKVDDIKTISPLVRDECVPHVTFLLDLDPEKGFKRGGRSDRMEKESIEFHRRVRNGFLELAKEDEKRFCVIDAVQPKEAVSKAIQERLDRELG